MLDVSDLIEKLRELGNTQGIQATKYGNSAVARTLQNNAVKIMAITAEMALSDRNAEEHYMSRISKLMVRAEVAEKELCELKAKWWVRLCLKLTPKGKSEK